jgi:hypothetical protein
MRVAKLVPLFWFSLLLCTQVTVLSLPDQVYAWMCCGCDCHRLGCCCPGQCGCAPYQCRTSAPDTFQAFTNAVRDFDVISRQVQVRQIGECARRSWAVRVLGDAAGDLKLEPVSFDFWAQSHRAVLQTAANPEG